MRQGWLTVSAWTLVCAGGPGIIANIIIGLATFNYETYQPKAWHTNFHHVGIDFSSLHVQLVV